MNNQPRIGHRVVVLDSVDSTNNYAAKALARQELGHGTAIMALEQTHGRGQRGRTWETEKGQDLTASFILKPEGLPAAKQFNLAKAAALAVHDVVAETLEEAGKDPGLVRVKWPNDVLVDRDKVAGILIANELQGASLSSSVVGIGINVNSRGWPSTLMATSLWQETRVQYDLRQLLDQLCGRLDHWWNAVGQAPEEVAASYGRLLWAKDRFAPFQLDGKPFMARPLEVDEAGRLLVEDEQGRVMAFGLERLRFARR